MASQGGATARVRVSFRDFELDLDQGRLLRGGREVDLERRTFDLLRYFVEHPDRLISKGELVREVWQVGRLSSGVTGTAISKLRRALGQSPTAREPIETVHGRGFRFHLRPLEKPVKPALDDPFVGRAALLAELDETLARAERSSGSLVLLSGDAGIGKTRLSRELSERARAMDFAVHSAAAHPGEGAPAFWPFIQVLRSVRESLGASRWQAHVPADARCIPALASHARAADETLAPERVRFQVFDEVTQLLRSLGAVTPLVIVLDDLHWADAASIELLAFAARALDTCPILFVATLRADEIPRDAAASFEALGRQASRFELSGLSRDEVTALTTALLGPAQPTAEIAGEVFRRTGGNPFFVRQLAALLRVEPDARELPPAVRDVLRRKLRSLSEPARRCLEVASVVGQEFRASLLAEVMQLPAATLLDRLEPALHAGVLEHARDTDRYAFAHALLHETLYEDLETRDRGALHAQTAAALEARAAAQTAGEIAHHYLRAVPSRLPEAVAACLTAAAEVQRAGGFDHAERLLSAALRKLDTEGGDAASRFELTCSLGENRFYRTAVELAWQAFREAAETALQLGDAERLARIAPQLVNCVDCGVGDPSYARAVVDRALELLSADQLAERASMLAHRAELDFALPAAARSGLLDEAAELAARSGEPAAILDVAHSRASLRDPTALEESRAAADAFVALLAEHKATADTQRYRTLRRLTPPLTRYVVELTDCDLAAADRALASIRELAGCAQLRAVLFAADFMQLGRTLAEGRAADVEREALAGLARVTPEDAPAISLVYGRFVFAAMRDQDRLAQFAAMEPPALQPACARQRTEAAIATANFFALTARPDAAREALRAIAPEIFARMPVAFGAFGSLCALAETYCLLNDRDGAGGLYAKLEPFARYNAAFSHCEYWGAVAHYLGELAQLLGRRADAAAHYELAVRVNHRLRMPLAAAASERALARARPRRNRNASE